MKYKIGDEVLVKCKIIDVHPDSTVPYGVARTRCNSGFAKPLYIIAGDEDIEEMSAEEAWDLARKIEAMRSDVLLEIFCMDSCYCILQDFTPQEAKAKIEAWEAENEIKVGDVVDHDGEIGIVTNTDDEEGFYNVLYSNGSTSAHDRRNLKKVGRHIDITGLLNQIGGADA